MASSSRSRSRSMSASRSPPSRTAPRIGGQKRGGRGRNRDVSEDEGEASDIRSPDSLGSGAMSESESERAPSADADDESVLFPLEGKFMSESDRVEIMGLPEIRREEILAERAQQMEEQRISMKLRQRAQAQEKEDAKAAERQKRKAAAVDLDESPRKAARPRTKASEALDQLKKSRADKAERARTGETMSKSKTDQLFDNDEEESEVEFDEGQPRTPAATVDESASVKDFARIVVGRSNFTDVCYTPGYENAVSGCFIRVCIGPDAQQSGKLTYRLYQIKNFASGRPYALEGRNGRLLYTDQWAVTSNGKAERKWEMKSSSNSPFTQEEFEHYKKSTLDTGKKLPSKAFLESKLTQLKNLSNHVWTDAEITHKLNRSAELQNPSVDRQKLQEERKKAEDEGDEATIAKIDKQLAAANKAKTVTHNVSQSKQIPAPTQQDRLAKINLANRKANIENIRRAQIEEKKAAQAVLRGEGKANRLERVRTFAKTFHDASGVKDSLRVDDLFGDASDVSKSGTPAISRAGTPTASQSNGTGKKKRQTDDEVMAALDMDIDIQI
ncbi:hypothetical protein FH972_022541 [Carpinus fangiana]|uniref:Plus3 domain-containing protein n=1 Tax=Carpinus fangiana TaxID=176857 RepID=A0A5N6KT32_9ROSI|nr:hypothetical protein FH972_022541 [Carpinus fangiana]